jgi:hypothetical protein
MDSDAPCQKRMGEAAQVHVGIIFASPQPAICRHYCQSHESYLFRTAQTKTTKARSQADLCAGRGLVGSLGRGNHHGMKHEDCSRRYGVIRKLALILTKYCNNAVENFKSHGCEAGRADVVLIAAVLLPTEVRFFNPRLLGGFIRLSTFQHATANMAASQSCYTMNER